MTTKRPTFKVNSEIFNLITFPHLGKKEEVVLSIVWMEWVLNSSKVLEYKLNFKHLRKRKISDLKTLRSGLMKTLTEKVFLVLENKE